MNVCVFSRVSACVRVLVVKYAGRSKASESVFPAFEKGEKRKCNVGESWKSRGRVVAPGSVVFRVSVCVSVTRSWRRSAYEKTELRRKKRFLGAQGKKDCRQSAGPPVVSQRGAPKVSE